MANGVVFQDRSSVIVLNALSYLKILTITGGPIDIERKSLATVTPVRPRHVDTLLLTLVSVWVSQGQGTLIHI